MVNSLNNSKRIIFILLCLQQAAISLNVAALSAAVPAIARDLAISDILAAKIIPYYMIPYGVGALVYAPLAKRISVRAIMAATMFLFAVTNFLCAGSATVGPILFYRVLMGAVSAGVVPLALILIGKTFGPEIRGRLVGLFFSCSFVASMTGIALSAAADWRWLFWLPGVLGLLTLVSIFLFRSDRLGKLEGKINYAGVFQNRSLLYIFIFITLMSTLYHGVDRWLGVYMDRIYHLKQAAISALFGVIAVSAAFGQNIGGYLTDKAGRRASCRVGILLLAGAILCLSFKSNIYILGVILVVLAVGWTIGHNGISTVLTDFSDEYRSEVASLNSSLRFLGGGIGFSISSIFVAQSFEMTFLVIGILLFILSLFLNKIIPGARST